MKILKRSRQKQPDVLIRLGPLKSQRSVVITRTLLFARILLCLAAFVILIPDAVSKVRQPPSSAFQNYAIVQRGDTLATVAHRCHSTPEKIIQDNGIKPPYKIYIGQPLKISASPNVDKHAKIHGKALEPKIYQNLAKSEGILKTQDHKPVSYLTLPESAFKPLKKPTLQKSLSKEAILPSKTNLDSQFITLPRRKPSSLKQENGYNSSSNIHKSKEAKLPLAQLNPGSQQNFLWPLKGKILSGFGAKSISKYNRGINISAALGDSVVACENGVVAYSGNEIKGFGNMILIKHANGWMSAYAHNRRLLVSRGDTVQRGQKIAEAGASGNVEQPQLHFELRQKTRAVDPQKYLGY